ncbi:MAG: DUF1016 N-terminal domain-containing protein [Candidatus Zapsychrus exili]|nr:DUF1016 N-terminal domain-containing protein [Candidatus Zapsychrus exili]
MADKDTKANIIGYEKLIADLKTILNNTKDKVKESISNIIAEGYWEFGQRIAQEQGLEKKQNILKQIAEDLKIEYSLLTRMVKFFQLWPNGMPQDSGLSWNHYKQLLAIENDAKRDFYFKEANQEKWGKRKLAQKIKDKYYEEKSFKETSAEEKIITKKTDLKRPTKASFVYKAEVLRVIDGDTILARIDLGFCTSREQRIRLASIDCPEMGTEEGEAARKYTEDALLGGLTFVMIKTNKQDIYGRYVAHIFYSKTEANRDKIFTEGYYLNQELIDEGFAKIF